MPIIADAILVWNVIIQRPMQIAPSIDVYHKFYDAYLKDNYEYICNTQSLYSIEEYVENNYENMHLLSIVQKKYSLDVTGDEEPFEKYVDLLISSDTAPMEEQESQVFCTCCGKKIAAKSNFCKYCGGKNIYKMD